jgi:formate dehydrogenase maturation protein FdhE
MAIGIAPSGRDIEREVRRFEPFEQTFLAFHARFDQERIFSEEPPCDSCGAVAAHLADGRYLLHAFKYQFDKSACQTAVFKLIEIFAGHLPVRKSELAHIQELFASRKLDAQDFITTVFRNRGDQFLEIVRKHGMDEDLTTFWAVYLARLFRVKAARHLCEDVTFFDWEDWQKGYCPVCGHWPALAHLKPGDESRTLWCLNCGTTWPFERLQCVYCLNSDQKRLGLLGPQDDPSMRVQACHDCREYLKEVQSPISVNQFSFDAHFLGSHSLDLFARGQGFIHESPLAVESDNTSSEAQLMAHLMRLPWDH